MSSLLTSGVPNPVIAIPLFSNMAVANLCHCNLVILADILSSVASVNTPYGPRDVETECG